MTTNSYGSALPRFDFEPLRPVARARVARALPLTVGIFAVPFVAAAGLAFYVQSEIARRHMNNAVAASSSMHQNKPAPTRNPYGEHEFWENLEVVCGVWT
ncbi:hypothetical protein DL769_011433 [Monosporascus sp. CRB-8-3]|nr:hypothetical protein DL769_011433 [Monosporascus sp. CRB-8-3]